MDWDRVEGNWMQVKGKIKDQGQVKPDFRFGVST